MYAKLRCIAVAGAVLTSGSACAVTLSSGDVQVDVRGGEAGRGMGDLGGYFSYRDIARGQITFAVDPLLRLADGSMVVLADSSLASGFAPAVAASGGAETSALSFGISSHARSVMDGNVVRTTFTFAAEPTATLNGATFLFYVDTDLPNLDSNTASFSGSIATGDLTLLQRGDHLSVRMTGEAESGSDLSLFGSGTYRRWTDAVGAGDLGALSSDGSNFATQGDLAMALGFSLSGASASLVVNYELLPVPEPDTWAMLLGGLLVFPVFAARARKTADLQRRLPGRPLECGFRWS